VKAKPKKSHKKPSAPPPAPEPSRPPGPRWGTHAAIILGLLIANLALYHGVVDLGFLSVDDPDYVQNNSYIENFKLANLKYIFTTPYAANYAPANLLSYSVDVAIAHGKHAAVVHLSNVLWHGWTVCMVYLLAFTIRAEVFSALAAAALFLLHPAHVEVVAWISSRKDLVGTSFAALAMTLYLLYRRAALKRSVPEEQKKEERLSPIRVVGLFLASLVSFLVASAGKQSVLLLPLVMLLWDWFVEKRRTWRAFADKVPYGLVTLFFGWMTWQAQPPTHQPTRAFTLAATELHNLWLLTGCGQYNLYRPAPDPHAWSLPAHCAIITLGLAIWFIPWLLARTAQKRARPQTSANPAFQPAIWMVLGYWVLIQMLPPMFLNFIVPITDRYLFLPSVGICLLVPSLCLWLARQWPRTRVLPWALVWVLCLVCLGKTWNYIQEWRDPRSVWYGAHLKTPNPQVAQFLGEIYQNAGDRISAFINSGTALDIASEAKLATAVLGSADQAASLRVEWQTPSNTKTNSTRYRDRLWDLAWEQYRDSLAHRGSLSTPNLFMNRGRLLVSQGKFEKAIPEFQTALAFARDSSYSVVRAETSTQALRAIGVAYWNMRRYKEGLPWYLEAQEVQKKSGQPWVPTLDQEVAQLKALAASQQ
jgi:hypothetical protein